MVKVKWETPYKGIKTKKHPTRKHGVKSDLYFAVRFQHNGKRCESGLGWSSEGWTLDEAIIKLNELKKQAKKGKGVKTHRTRQKEADQAKIEQQQKECAAVEKKAKDSLSVSEYFHKAYYPQIQKEKKLKTHLREESLFRLWIDTNIGHLPFKEITKSNIENIFYDIVDSGKSIRSAEYALTTLKQIWREAKEVGYAPDMPALSKTLKKKISQNNNARIRFLSHDEANTLLEELRERSQDLYEKTLISLHCGLRAKEIFTLTWSQIDLAHGIFNIIDSKGKDRSVHMSEQVKEIMLLKTKGNPDELIYPGRQGRVSTQISQVFREVANQLFNKGITDRRERVTFHTMRHSCASWMVMQGISLYLVQKVLGHSTIQVTEKYSHLAPDQLQLAANAIDKVVMQQKEKNIIPFQKKG
jgi:integrase